jgi:hypothetical protein
MVWMFKFSAGNEFNFGSMANGQWSIAWMLIFIASNEFNFGSMADGQWSIAWMLIFIASNEFNFGSMADGQWSGCLYLVRGMNLISGRWLMVNGLDAYI